MLPFILSAASLLLVGVNLFLLWQGVSCLKKHKNEPLEAITPYLLRRLNAFLLNSFLIAALQIALIILR